MFSKNILFFSLFFLLISVSYATPFNMSFDKKIVLLKNINTSIECTATSQNIIDQYNICNLTYSGFSPLVRLNNSILFDSKDNVSLDGVDIWTNLSHTTMTPIDIYSNHTYLLQNEINFTATPITSNLDCSWGRNNNKYYYNVTYPSGQGALFCFDSYNESSVGITLLSAYSETTLTPTEQWYYDWKDISDQIIFTNYSTYTIGSIEQIWRSNEPKTIRYRYSTLPYSSGKFSILLGRSSIRDQLRTSSNVFLNLDPWWNTTWQYCTQVNITGSFPANYSHLLLINSTGFNTSAMNSDLSDIRILEGTCNTPNGGVLSDWNDTINLAGNSYVWVRVPDSSGSVSTLAVYYGNPTAPAAWNGTDTFVYFDDATTNKTSSYTAKIGGVVWNSSGFYNPQTATSWNMVYVTGAANMTNLSTMIDFILTNVTSGSLNLQPTLFDRVDATNTKAYEHRYDMENNPNATAINLLNNNFGTETQLNKSPTYSAIANNTYTLYSYEAGSLLYTNLTNGSHGTQFSNTTINDATLTTGMYGFGSYVGSGMLTTYVQLKRFIVRQYQSSEPTYAYGPTQTAPSGGSTIFANLNTPQNNTVTSNTTITFNWTVNGSSASYLSNLTVDGVTNVSNIASTNATAITQAVSGFTNGTHNWSVTSWNATTTNTSQTWFFNVSIISFVSPTPPNNSNISTTPIQLNISSTLPITSPCTIQINGTNTSGTLSGNNNCLFNLTPITNGNVTYNITAYLNVSSNILQANETRTINWFNQTSCMQLLNFYNITQNLTTSLILNSTRMYVLGNASINNTCPSNVTNGIFVLNDSTAVQDISYIVSFIGPNTQNNSTNISFYIPVTYVNGSIDKQAFLPYNTNDESNWTTNYSRPINSSQLPVPLATTDNFNIYICGNSSTTCSTYTRPPYSNSQSYVSTNGLAYVTTGLNLYETLVRSFDVVGGNGNIPPLGGGGSGNNQIPTLQNNTTSENNITNVTPITPLIQQNNPLYLPIFILLMLLILLYVLYKLASNVIHAIIYIFIFFAIVLAILYVLQINLW